MFYFVFTLFTYVYHWEKYCWRKTIERLKKKPIFSKTSFWKQIHDFNLQIKPSAKADQLELSEKTKYSLFYFIHIAKFCNPLSSFSASPVMCFLLQKAFSPVNMSIKDF